MNNKNKYKDNLKNEAPFLANIKKENTFITPKDYFEVLPQVMSDKILNKKSIGFSFDKLSWRILMPSVACLGLLLLVFTWNNPTTENELNAEQLSVLIIEEDYFEIDAYLVYDTYAEILEENENSNSTEADEYINYLIENNIDLQTIIEEL